MKGYGPQQSRVEFRVLKKGARVPGHGDPTVDAISRWENDGGAPDRRSEFDNHTVRNDSPLIVAP
jgi:hypothetical protein